MTVSVTNETARKRFPRLGSKERPRNGISGFCPREKMGREPKKRVGGEGEGKEDAFSPLPCPSILIPFLAFAPFFAR